MAFHRSAESILNSLDSIARTDETADGDLAAALAWLIRDRQKKEGA